MSNVAVSSALRAGLIVVAAVLSASALRGYQQAFAWVFAAWSIVFALEAAAGRRSLRFLCVNAAAAFGTLAAVELWWGRVERANDQRERAVPTYQPQYTRLDDVLGYAPIASMKVASMLTKEGRSIYDVRYTIDERGLRVSPPCDCGDHTRSLLFFGCSYTYGEGVGDQETLPYRAGVHTGGRYAVYNFGFHGYGPHQMLAALERGMVKSRIEHPPRFAFYTAIVDHVRRAAGRATWDTFLGPRYVLSGDTVRYAGPFKDSAPVASEDPLERAGSLLAKSAILRRLRPGLGDADAAETLAAIVDAARVRFERDFPGAEFQVLFWGAPSARLRDLTGRLERRGVVVHQVAAVLPGYSENPERYEISGESHPTAEAYDLVARYLAERLVDR
jgi:hypothetical protein